MNDITANCLMCGKIYSIGKDDKDYNKLSSGNSSTYICDMCNHKIRYEKEEQDKPAKPM